MTGVARIGLTDSVRRYIWTSQEQRYGVNGVLVPTAASDVTRTWFEQVAIFSSECYILVQRAARSVYRVY